MSNLLKMVLPVRQSPEVGIDRVKFCVYGSPLRLHHMRFSRVYKKRYSPIGGTEIERTAEVTGTFPVAGSRPGSEMTVRLVNELGFSRGKAIVEGSLPKFVSGQNAFAPGDPRPMLWPEFEASSGVVARLSYEPDSWWSGTIA